MNIPKVKFNSNNKVFIEKIFLGYLQEGYIIKKAYTRKKYVIFGSVKYYVEMEIDTIGYEILIKNAMEKEDYLEVDRLKKELELLQLLRF
jgi:hypothetical protein